MVRLAAGSTQGKFISAESSPLTNMSITRTRVAFVNKIIKAFGQ